MTGVIEFGTQLIDTLDLDPVYPAMLYGIEDPAQRARACVAYWLYYHLGVACKLSETPGPQFWIAVRDVLETAPRGTERRHFRGVKALAAVRTLRSRFKGGARPLIEALTAPETSPPCDFPAQDGPSGPGPRGTDPLDPADAALGLKTARRKPGENRGSVRFRTNLTFSTVRSRVMTFPQFGPWIAFKVADMLERVLKKPVDFRDCPLLDFYEEPRAGAELAVSSLKVRTPQAALDKLVAHFRSKLPTWAPPSNNRMINIQEIETILCKWKSHMNGHYEIGKDTHEVVHGLHAYPSTTGGHCLLELEKRSPILLKQKARRLV